MANGWQGGPGARPVSLDDLIALNDEIAALTRSGMPLENGLLDLGSDVPGRLGALSRTLGERMRAGASLSEALDASGAGVPPVYRAVVEAGVRSGRLPVALEGMAAYARGFAEARRSIGLALGYPLLVMVLAYGLFVLLVTLVIPRFVEAFAGLGLPVHPALRGLAWAGTTAAYWAPVLPLLGLAGLVAWVLSRRAGGLGAGRRFGLLRLFPWLRSVAVAYEAASFADLLALLVGHGVPYPEALTLAGKASGDRAIERSSAALADSVSRGLPPTEVLKGPSAFPPMLRWVLASGSRQGDLVTGLNRMSERYRNLARFQSEKLRILLPTILLFGIGATSCLLYALALFLPLTTLWNALALQAP